MPSLFLRVRRRVSVPAAVKSVSTTTRRPRLLRARPPGVAVPEVFDATDGLPDGGRPPPGTSPYRPNAARGPTRAGWSSSLPRSTPSSASSRPARRPTSSCCGGAYRGRIGPACSRPSGTGPPSTGCSTGTPATWRDAGRGSRGPTGPSRTGARSGGKRSRGSGRAPRPGAGQGPAVRGRGARALPGPDPRDRAAARAHRVGGRDGRTAAGRDQARRRRTRRAVGPAGAGGAGRPGPGRAGPRRPVRVQPPGPRRAAGS